MMVLYPIKVKGNDTYLAKGCGEKRVAKRLIKSKVHNIVRETEQRKDQRLFSRPLLGNNE